MKHKKTILYVLIALIAVLFLGGATAYYLFFFRIFNINQTEYIYIRPGDKAEDVFKQIDQVANPNTIGLKWVASYYHYSDRVHEGRYAVKPEDNAFTLVRRLVTGTQTPVNVTIPSVRTMDKLAAVIGQRLMLDSATIASRLMDTAYCASLGYTPQTIPCLFIPNTYQMYWNISADKFFARMVQENKRFWNEKRTKEAQDAGLTPQQVIIIASIVDEETAKNDEKPIVAGLYINRFKQGMLLQADPTVKFAYGDFTLRRITGKHLATNSPYNTYIYKGLPPGPIRIPSIAGIESVLHYAHHDYLYMCAKEDFSGYHNFAKTMAEHQLNARRYQQELNRRNIR